jgi:hypothetical protein
MQPKDGGMGVFVAHAAAALVEAGFPAGPGLVAMWVGVTSDLEALLIPCPRLPASETGANLPKQRS